MFNKNLIEFEEYFNNLRNFAFFHMKSAQVRKAFLDFFKSKQHQYVHSSPIVNKNDPTLLFTNSGMNQFKDIFTGNQKPTYLRVANSQKCLRVSGKHNDLEDVGLDTYHHTMFEMLGNWSFGDYFKKEAIEWAWEFLTEVLKINKNLLYVTVFAGDDTENLPKDIESAELWKQWIEENRILFFGKKENFWEMGETGPCGPCSEIHIDLRPEQEKNAIPGQSLVNKDHPQVIEIWNLVFMQFYRKQDGSLEPLAMKSVDTGMGFERLCRALEHKTSNYDTDIFEPLKKALENISSLKYGENEKVDIAFRVVMDHTRAVTFAIADGQLPTNTGAGYVIRRIMRRAIRYAFQYLQLKQPFIHSLVPVLAKQFEDIFPEIIHQQKFIETIIQSEEQSFLRTLSAGIELFENYILENQPQTIDGQFAFTLYDTYGFPIDLTQLMAKEKGLTVDLETFETCMLEQKNRSKAATKIQFGDWIECKSADLPIFVGYDTLEVECEIVKYREVKKGQKKEFQIVIDRTPFYAESGGQVGDKGILSNANQTIQVLDCIKENELNILICNELPKNPEGTWLAKVNQSLRDFTRFNHTATHLLHAALRTVLGKHVEQKGSLVHPEYLRFDFSHFQKISDSELEQIENLVNQKIQEGISLIEHRNVPIEEAKKMGAMALFGEKYGDYVRVIEFDKNFSIELCGGTHVQNTSQIRLFKILSETSIASGIRRIEAVTNEAAWKFLINEHKLLEKIKNLLKNPKNVYEALESLLSEKTALEKRLEQLLNEKMLHLRDQLFSQWKQQNQKSYLVQKIEIDNADLLKQLSFELRKITQKTLIALGANIQGKAMLSVIFSEDLEPSEKLNAANIIKEASKFIQGGGGGQPFYATAGGKKLDGLEDALKKIQEMIVES